METEPTSRLTRERPDLWRRALDIATAQTGCVYAPKMPLADGTIYACSYAPPPPPRPLRPYTPAEDTERERLEKERDGILRSPGDYKPGERERVAEINRRLDELSNARLLSPPLIYVPDGAMEWLLHEVGHWVAATPAERLLPNYGVGSALWGRDAEQEWQAWAFEDIILAPWGPARLFAPPEQQDGVGFSKAGPIEQAYLDHAERQMRAAGVEIERWRALYAEWVTWEQARLRN